MPETLIRWPGDSQMLPALLLALVVLLTGCASGDSPPLLSSGGGYGYPEAARRAGTEGKVKVRYDIGIDGAVRNAVVIGSEPPGVFDETALKTVRSWKFTPRRENGRAAEQPGVISEVTFSLSGEERYKGY